MMIIRYLTGVFNEKHDEILRFRTRADEGDDSVNTGNKVFGNWVTENLKLQVSIISSENLICY